MSRIFLLLLVTLQLSPASLHAAAPVAKKHDAAGGAYTQEHRRLEEELKSARKDARGQLAPHRKLRVAKTEFLADFTRELSENPRPGVAELYDLVDEVGAEERERAERARGGDKIFSLREYVLDEARLARLRQSPPRFAFRRFEPEPPRNYYGTVPDAGVSDFFGDEVRGEQRLILEQVWRGRNYLVPVYPGARQVP